MQTQATLQTQKFRSLTSAVALALVSIAFAGCTTTGTTDQASTASSRSAIDANVQATLSKFYTSVTGSREMVSKAAGVLVFPSVVGASFVVGADYGKGSMLINGKPDSYYSTSSGSIGFQAGAQSKAVIYLFNTKESLEKFRSSKGWTAGVDATVAVAAVGANGSVDTQSAGQPVVSFVMTNGGLEAGVSVSGSKITKLEIN